eukprot:CAMPEP_0114458308 /NCGR_PEP_ID=MMETSP0104-20121206/4618_1 /TAXON_ID=37642 ORGANISM="Paraphysomonas imperforata, Strain PA2" /NCGR_SAMPLE_ID=MMETSP0104 /ASSEMBLY_ACC=CAM_ASM_000202 /LENGTH=275 /DNA_ID=CAMNT_0001630895 /DNA_START=391 /DNA_END=1218 /DNA_ORIENTATION=-
MNGTVVGGGHCDSVHPAVDMRHHVSRQSGFLDGHRKVLQPDGDHLALHSLVAAQQMQPRLLGGLLSEDLARRPLNAVLPVKRTQGSFEVALRQPEEHGPDILRAGRLAHRNASLLCHRQCLQNSIFAESEAVAHTRAERQSHEPVGSEVLHEDAVALVKAHAAARTLAVEVNLKVRHQPRELHCTLLVLQSLFMRLRSSSHCHEQPQRVGLQHSGAHLLAQAEVVTGRQRALPHSWRRQPVLLVWYQHVSYVLQVHWPCLFNDIGEIGWCTIIEM